MNFNQEYLKLLDRIFKQGVEDFNQRTRTIIYFKLHEQISHDFGGIPLTTHRKIFPHIAMAELMWTLSGVKDISWLSKYTNIWSKFAIKNEVEAAYGYRWRKAFGRDQLQLAIDTLKKNPSDRQVVIMAWDPREDALGNTIKTNVPCPLGFSLQAYDSLLNMQVYQRSSDVICGLPYDMLMYSLLLDLLSIILGMKPGKISFSLSHAHIYDKHYDEAFALFIKANDKPLNFPFSFSNYINKDADLNFILSKKDLFIEIIKEIYNKEKYNLPISPMEVIV